MSRNWEIHDNGGRPYIVQVLDDEKKNLLSILAQSDNEEKYLPLEGFVCVPFTRLWIGKSVKEENVGPDGSNVLYQDEKSGKYVQIGAEIIDFDLDKDEQVQSYMLQWGGNDVPMPYIVTSKRTYLLGLGNKFLKINNVHRPRLRQERNNVDDPYNNEYYPASESLKKRFYRLFDVRQLKPRTNHNLIGKYMNAINPKAEIEEQDKKVKETLLDMENYHGFLEQGIVKYGLTALWEDTLNADDAEPALKREALRYLGTRYPQLLSKKVE